MFKSILTEHNGSSWGNYMIKQIFVLFGYYQNFTAIIVFTTLNNIIIYNEAFEPHFAALIQVVICFSIFSISKYNLLLEYFMAI